MRIAVLVALIAACQAGPDAGLFPDGGRRRDALAPPDVFDPGAKPDAHCGSGSGSGGSHTCGSGSGGSGASSGSGGHGGTGGSMMIPDAAPPPDGPPCNQVTFNYADMSARTVWVT